MKYPFRRRGTCCRETRKVVGRIREDEANQLDSYEALRYLLTAFKTDDFASPTVHLPGFGGYVKAALKRDDVLVSVFPSIKAILADQNEEQVGEDSRPRARPKETASMREHRRVISFLIN